MKVRASNFIWNKSLSVGAVKERENIRSTQRKVEAGDLRWLIRRVAGLVAVSSLFAPQIAFSQTVNPLTSPYGSSSALVGQQQQQSQGQTNNGNNNGNPSTGNSQSQTTVSTDSTFQPGNISGSSNSNATSQSDNSDQKGSENDKLDLSGTRMAPPATPGEFEAYVRQATGQKIKRFGADLLLPSVRDFAVPAVTTVPPDYAINAGDVISVDTTGAVQGSASLTVDHDGAIFIPEVGKVSVAGVLYRDLHDKIAAAINKKYRKFDVAVSIKKLRGVRVYVTGFANNPGAYTVNSLSTLVNAVLAAGGPSAGGSFRMVELFRNGQQVSDFDLYKLIRDGNRNGDAVLQNGDVLFIPPAGKQIAVIGSVNDAAIYEARPGDTLEKMLGLAGGPNNMADHSRLFLYRLSDKGTIGSRELTNAEAADTVAQKGDIVQVVSKGSLAYPLERQSMIVRIEGEVNKPGNYFVPPNTRLSTVLKMAGGLSPRAYVYGTRLVRQSVRAQQRVNYRIAIDQLESTLASAPLLRDPALDSSDQSAQITAAQVLLARLKNTQPDGRLVLDIPYDATSLPGNVLLENNDSIVVPPRLSTAGVFGAVYRPASFLLGTGKAMRVKDLIEKAGGTQRQADDGHIFVVRANGSVLTKKKGAMHAVVQPGDVVFVPVKTHSKSFLQTLLQISQVIFQFGLSTAAIAAVTP